MCISLEVQNSIMGKLFWSGGNRQYCGESMGLGLKGSLCPLPSKQRVGGSEAVVLVMEEAGHFLTRLSSKR